MSLRATFLLASFVAISAEYLAAFEHGIASGDPHSDSIVLWTRMTPQLPLDAQPAPIGLQLNVSWRVWRADADASRPERSGVFSTDGRRDWTVKVIASGLEHSVRYRFGFALGAAVSPAGNFRLPPPADAPLDVLRYAVFSCSSWSWGYFNAYRAAATQAEPLDFWLHVGDYFYECRRGGPKPAPRRRRRRD